MAHDKRSQRTARPPRKLPESQSKFDRWLEMQVERKSKVTFSFSEEPYPGVVGKTMTDCTVIAVDRYMLLLEFYEGDTWWTSKANILSASTTDA